MAGEESQLENSVLETKRQLLRLLTCSQFLGVWVGFPEHSGGAGRLRLQHMEAAN